MQELQGADGVLPEHPPRPEPDVPIEGDALVAVHEVRRAPLLGARRPGCATTVVRDNRTYAKSSPGWIYSPPQREPSSTATDGGRRAQQRDFAAMDWEACWVIDSDLLALRCGDARALGQNAEGGQSRLCRRGHPDGIVKYRGSFLCHKCGRNCPPRAEDMDTFPGLPPIRSRNHWLFGQRFPWSPC